MGGADFRWVREEELFRWYKLWHAPPEGLREGASGRPRSSKAPSESRVTFTDHRSPEFIRGPSTCMPEAPATMTPSPPKTLERSPKTERGERLIKRYGPA